MDSYQSLHVWRRAHSLVIATLRETETRQPKTWAVFDQLRRAAVSVEANIVEGYALRLGASFDVIFASLWDRLPNRNALSEAR
jgi:hypothetical protein